MSEIGRRSIEMFQAECERMDAPNSQAPSELSPAPLLEPATCGSRTIRCWRDGKWQADELANLAAKLERENAELEATINTLHNLCASAEKRAFRKIEEERAAAGSNAGTHAPATKKL